MILAGCGTTAASSDEAPASAAADTSTESERSTSTQGSSEDDVQATGSDGGATNAALDELITELPPAPVGFPGVEDEPRPARLTIESLGIVDAPVIGVGVESDGAMEVPPADQVGWYRYSPIPGQDGSSILAAHIAFNGENGVFVRLSDIQPGAVVEVTDGDGQVRPFVVESVEQYDKEQLPEDIVYARDGEPRLVLVTCGGRFDRSRNSYDDNVVVVTRPAEQSG